MSKTSVKLTIAASLVKEEDIREVVRWGSFLEPRKPLVIDTNNAIAAGTSAAIVCSDASGHHAVKNLKTAKGRQDANTEEWLEFELEEDTSSVWCWQADACESIVGQFCVVTDYHLIITQERRSASITLVPNDKAKAFWSQPTVVESLVKEIAARCLSQNKKKPFTGLSLHGKRVGLDVADTEGLKLTTPTQVATWAIESIHLSEGTWELSFDATDQEKNEIPPLRRKMVLAVTPTPMKAKGLPARIRHTCLGGQGDWSLRAAWAHDEKRTEHICAPECKTGTFLYNLISGGLEVLKEQKYIALSYVWKHYDAVGLKELLDKMAASMLWEYVWVDRLCIDQACSKHKQDQVPKMGKIYKEAQEVIVLMEDLGVENSGVFVRQGTEVIERDNFLKDFYRHEWHSRVWT